MRTPCSPVREYYPGPTRAKGEFPGGLLTFHCKSTQIPKEPSHPRGTENWKEMDISLWLGASVLTVADCFRVSEALGNGARF